MQSRSGYEYNRIVTTGGSTPEMAICVNDAERLRIDSAGNVGIGEDNPICKLNVNSGTTDLAAQLVSSDANVFLAFKDGDASGNQQVQIGGVGNNYVVYAGGNERLRINSQGEVLVGVSTRAISVPGYTTPRIVQAEIKGPIDTSSGKHYGSLALNCTDENAALHLIRSQANNSADLDAGLIGFTVFDGTDYHQCARIQASRDAAGGDNDTPGRLTFFTTADGESSATERLRITSTGKVCINNDTALSDLHVCTAGSSEQDGTLRIGGTNAELGLVLDYDQASNTVADVALSG